MTKIVKYGDNGYLWTKPREERFAILGNFSSGTDADYATELDHLEKTVALLRSAPSYRAIEMVRQANVSLDQLVTDLATQKSWNARFEK